VYRRVDVQLDVVGVEVGTRSMHSYNAEDLGGIDQAPCGTPQSSSTTIRGLLYIIAPIIQGSMSDITPSV